MPLQIRRGTTAQRLSIIPLQGEPIFDTDQNLLYIGNGVTAGGQSLTGIDLEDARDAVAAMLVNGQHDGIQFIYGTAQDVNDRIDARIDLSNYDGEIVATALRGPLFADDSSLIVNSASKNISANDITAVSLTVDTLNLSTFTVADFKGSVFADDSTLLVDAVSGSINLNGTVKGNVIPDANETYDLGSASNRFKDLYLSGSSLFLGSAQITATGSVVNLPAGSTVGGTPIGSGSGDGVVAGSNYNINIVADDSTFMVNSFTKEFTGTLTGDLFTNTIDSSTSSTITIVPAVTMNSDLLVENELTVTNSVTAATFNGSFFGPQYGNVWRADNNIIVNHTNGDIAGNIVDAQELRVSLNAATAVLNLDRTNAGSTAVTTNDEIGHISARGFTGSGLITGTRIVSKVRESIGSGMPSTLDFQVNGTTDSLTSYFSVVGGSVGRVEAYRPLQVFDDVYRPAVSILGVWQYHDTPDATNISFGRTRGSGSSQAPVQLGDDIADLAFLGGNGSGYGTAVSISVVVDDNLSTSNVPGKLIIRTNNGVTGTAERLSIDHLGVTTITGTTNLVGNASVTGSLSADLIGSVFSDTSSMIIDGTDGSVMVANVNFKGQTGNIPLDTGTPDSWLEVTVNGATKYIPLYD